MEDQAKTALERMILQSLESLQAAGVQQLEKAVPVSPAEVELEESSTQQPAPQSQVPSSEPPVPPVQATAVVGESLKPQVSLAPSLEVLQGEVAACSLCEELASTRTQTVFGVGNPEARLCFLGEAPGADEDRQGEPFVGRGGQLLNKIIEACQMRREDAYILNVLRCRPPNNRNPTDEEAHNCRQYLDRQLQLVNPEFICCLGAVAAQNLLSTTAPIGRLRGKLHDYQGMKVLCTYHPAYLLRNPSAKRLTWDDMKLLMREMGTPVD